MCNVEILALINSFQRGNSQAFMPIYYLFEKLIRAFSRKMNYEDAQSELTLFLLELVSSFDINDHIKFPADESFSIQRYLAVCLRNQMIALSKHNQKRLCKYVNMEDDTRAVNVDFELHLLLHDALQQLTIHQKQIITYRYFYGIHVAEIASHLDISRQAVNQALLRGLAILRQYIEDKPSKSEL